MNRIIKAKVSFCYDLKTEISNFNNENYALKFAVSCD